jgi:hypothetical protein
VAGLGTASGQFNFQWAITPTNAQVPVITIQPVSQTVAVGGAATFSVASVPTNATVQWFFNDQAIAGATNRVLNIANVDTSHVGSYSARVTTGGESATTVIAMLQINNSEGVVEPVPQCG